MVGEDRVCVIILKTTKDNTKDGKKQLKTTDACSRLTITK